MKATQASAIIFSIGSNPPSRLKVESVGEPVRLHSSSFKVAILHYSAPPIVGGVERVVKDQAEGLLAAGVEVRVVAARGAQWNPGIPFVQVPEMDSLFEPALRIQRALLQGQSALEEFETLTTTIAQILSMHLAHIDVAIVHNIMTMHKNMPLVQALRSLAATSTSPRIVVWTHDIASFDDLYAHEIGHGYPWSLLSEPLESAAYVTVSEARKRQLAAAIGLDTDRIEVIPNPLDALDVLQVSEDTRQLIRHWSLERRWPLILMPVRITRRKRIELAIKAIAQLLDQFPHIVLVVTGPPGPHNPTSGNYVAELVALRSRLGLDRHVIFLQQQLPHHRHRALPEATVYELMRLADVVLLTSSHEGFGLPAAEAALLRVPLVTVDLEPIRQMVGPYATYVAADAGPGGVASALLNVLEGVSCWPRRALMENLDREVIVRNQVLPLLERVAAGKG